jgi:hypothetical protein
MLQDFLACHAICAYYAYMKKVVIDLETFHQLRQLQVELGTKSVKDTLRFLFTKKSGCSTPSGDAKSAEQRQKTEDH